MISARVIAPIEGARFVYDKKPLQKPTYVTIWENMYGEGGRSIYEPHEQIRARIEATIDTLIKEFAEAWTHSQGIGHPKYGAPYSGIRQTNCSRARRGPAQPDEKAEDFAYADHPELTTFWRKLARWAADNVRNQGPEATAAARL